MKIINDILDSFSPISLTEMDSVKLMKRTDTKFVISKSDFMSILPQLQKHYRALSINDTKIASYKTNYFDTASHELYLYHHNEKLNRYKIRFREYIESDLSFLEVKFKSNKGKTVKSRIKSDFSTDGFSKDALTFLDKKLPIIPSTELKHTLENNFSRLTFVNLENKERLTIDLGLTFSFNEKKQPLENVIIIELKQEKANRSSPFMQLMNERHISPDSFSKYCIGVALLNNTIKQNRFKSLLLKINNIEKNGNIRIRPI